MMLTLNIPTPPSDNALFKTLPNGFRAPSQVYREWKKATKADVFAQWYSQERPEISKPYAVTLRVALNRRSDVSNRGKAILDLLVSTIPGFPDDRWLDRLVIERAEVEGMEVEVTSLAPLANEARSIGDIIKPIVARVAASQGGSK